MQATARTQVEDRVARFLTERLLPALHRATAPLEVAGWRVDGEPVPFGAAAAADYCPVAVGTPWGAPWSTTWFRIRGDVPQAWRDPAGALPPGTRAELLVDLGFTDGQPGFQAEGLVWGMDGVPIKGVAPRNRAVPAAVDPSGRVDVLLEAAANPDLGGDWSFAPTPLGDPETAGDEPLYRLGAIEIGLLDETVRELVADVRVLLGLVPELPPGAPRAARVLAALERMLEAVDPADVVGTAASGRAALAPVLAQPATASAHLLHAVGHAHIDSAWLWPIRETARKCARTFANVLALMDEDPDVVFACSSAQQFAWIKEQVPALYARIAERVREGRFVPVGGMWVESDTNLPGGEALARQFVAGKRFFLEEFGVECEEVWLPDSFGYSGALPQIARLAGMRRLLTQKLS